MDINENTERWVLAYCPSRSEAASIEEWYEQAKDNLESPLSLDEFRHVAEDLADRGVIRKSNGRFFDPQKTTRH